MANLVRQQPLFIMHAVFLVAVAYTALMVVPSCMVLTDGARVFNPIATDTAPSSASCKALASVCATDKDCCSESCLLFVCVLPYEKKLEMERLMQGNVAHHLMSKEIALQAATGKAPPTCKALASVCKLDEECCSESCLLFVCVLPYEKNEIVGLVEMARTKVALQGAAPTCLPIGGVCSKDKDCCSDSCLLFLCTLPYERSQLEAPINMDSNNKVAILEKAPSCLPIGGVCSKDKDCCSDSCLLFLCSLPYEEKKLEEVDSKKVAIPGIKAPTCEALASVCKLDKECCSESCLLFVCVLPYEKNEIVGLFEMARTKVALQEKAPTCLPIGGVCTKDKDCCSDSCLLFLCTLPYERNQLEAPINMDSNNKVARLEKAPSCLPIGGVCSKDKDCCSDSCLLFLCTLPYEEKKLEEVNSKRAAIPGIKAPTCKALASVCKLDEECCSESCLLFVCVLPYEKKEIVGLVEMARTKVALQEKAPTCLAIGGVCSKDKDCCSDSCLLFLCTLPYERNQLEAPINMDSNNKVTILEKAPSCLPIGGVCSKDKDCCSDSCLLFLCSLPYEEKKLEEGDSKRIAIPGKAPTCLPIGGVCSKDKDCCSDSCLLFLCTLPYVESDKLEAPINANSKNVAPKKEKGYACLPFGSVCSKDKDCCSDSCLLLVCVLPYMEDNKGQQQQLPLQYA